MNNSKFNNIQISLSAVSHFITDIYQSFIVGLIPILVGKFELSLFKVSLLTATSVIANSLFSPVFGYFSDRHGLKYFLVSGPLMTSIFLSLIGILPNYYLLLTFLFIGNLGIAAYHPASAAVAGHFGGQKKGIGSSIINFGGNFGNALGVLLIILIAERININLTPIAMIPGILMAIIILKLVPNKPSWSIDPIYKSQDQNYKSSYYNYNNANNNNSHIYKINSAENYSIKRNYFINQTGYKSSRFFAKVINFDKRKFSILLLIMLSIYALYILWITMVTYMPLYYRRDRITLIDVGIIMFLFGGLGGAGGLISGYLSDRFKKGNFIIQAGFILAVPLFYFMYRTPVAVSMILFILGGIFLISVQPVCIRLTQDLLPKNMSFASSLILGFSPGIAGITMIFLGKAADRIGIVRLVNYELIFAVVISLVLFSYLPIEKKINKK